MDAPESRTNSLEVEHFRVECLVPADHPGPHRVKERMEAAASRLPDLLRSTLGAWFEGQDESVWLIRRLDLQLDVNAAWSLDQLARHSSAEIARSLAGVFEGGSEAGVLRFKSRSAYLSQFLADLAAGASVWDKWYYRRFRGLQRLPVSAALRTALIEEPDTGWTALQVLPEEALSEVASTLTAADAHRLLEHAPAGDAEAPGRCFDLLWQAWNEESKTARPVAHEEQEALRLYVWACRRQPERVGPTLRSLARALVRLVRHLTQQPRSEAQRLITALTATDSSMLNAFVTPTDAEVLSHLQNVPPGRILDAGRALLARNGEAVREGAGAETDQENASRSTRFGGIFFLLPLLDELRVGARERAAPAREDQEAEDFPLALLLRFLMLGKCLGRPRAHQVFSDPLVRDLMGMDAAPALADALRKQEGISSRGRLDTWMSTWAAWQQEKGAVEGRVLALHSVALPGAPAGVLLDLQRGIWLLARGFPPSEPRRMVGHVEGWLAQTEFAPDVFICDAMFADALRETYPGAAVHPPCSPFATELRQQDGQRVRGMALLDQLEEDLDYLLLPRSVPVSRPLDLTLSVAAQSLLRTFAWRLSGFATSSLPYLFTNFLDLPATVEEEPDRRIVRLGQPPLQFVLGMTGMARGTYRLSWLGERPLVLFQEGG